MPTTNMNQAVPCGMALDPRCSTIIGLWAVGQTGICNHPNIGYRLGAKGYRKAVMQARSVAKKCSKNHDKHNS